MPSHVLKLSPGCGLAHRKQCNGLFELRCCHVPLQKEVLFRTQCYLHNIERSIVCWSFIYVRANRTLPATAYSGWRDELCLSYCTVYIFVRYSMLHYAVSVGTWECGRQGPWY